MRNITRKPEKFFDVDEAHHADGGGAHDDEIPEGHDGTANLVSKEPAERTQQRADQGPEEGDGDGHRRELRLDQERKRRGVADEGAESPDIDVRHDPGVLAAEDRQLIPQGGACVGEIVHEQERPRDGDCQRQQPHQPGVRQIDAAGAGRRQVQIDQSQTQKDGGEQLQAADSDIAAGGVEPQRPAFHAIGIEE
jgi:hypothetical protein